MFDKKSMENKALIDLSRNESRLGCNPVVAARLVGFERRLSTYPDVTAEDLRTVLAAHHRVENEWVITGNGSVEVLEHCMRALLHTGDEVILPLSTFTMLPELVQRVGARVVGVPLKHWFIDLQATLEAVTSRTRMVLLVNPNNPTGTVLTRDEIVNFLTQLPSHVCVVIDEAYIDYVSPEKRVDMAPMVKEFEHLIVTRTFSKAHGLAALRVGYCLASPRIARKVRSFCLPFSNNSPGLEAAALSIRDQNFLACVRAFNNTALAQLSEGLGALGLRFLDSEANFVSIEFGRDAKRIFNGLKAFGILVAPQSGANMPGYLRVTVGNAEDNALLLSRLRYLVQRQFERHKVYEA